MDKVDETSLKAFDKLLLPFKKFRGLFKTTSVYGKIAMLVQVILIGFGPLVLGQLELGLLFVALIYGLSAALAFVIYGYVSGALAISLIAFIIISVILAGSAIASWYISFNLTIRKVEALEKDEPIFNSIIYNFLKKLIFAIGHFFRDWVIQFRIGNARVRIALLLSLFSFGIPQLIFGEVTKGIAFLSVQVLIIAYMIAKGAVDVSKFLLMGIPTNDYEVNPEMTIIFGVVAIFVIALFVFFYVMNIKQVLKIVTGYNEKRFGDSIKKQFRNIVDKHFYVSALLVPVVGALTFTIIPIAFMIFIAFTNYSHNPNYIDGSIATNVINWIGLDTFKRVFADASNLADFLSVFSWTIIWAALATFTCFFGGLFLAMLINKKTVKFKAVYRSLFVISMAMPQFVSLLTMKVFFEGGGPFQGILTFLHLYGEGSFLQDLFTSWNLVDNIGNIAFWKNPMVAKALIIFINMWVGIPYYMLLTSGLLINIPKSYYEAARISGASRWKQFTRITFPNLMFMTAPMLITSFVSNITNFNVIWFLTQGEPANTNTSGVAGQTDILITWLYKLTMKDSPDYTLGAAIGILMFILMATLSLVVFRNTSSYKNEEEYR